jgi:hypothetical protein
MIPRFSRPERLAVTGFALLCAATGAAFVLEAAWPGAPAVVADAIGFLRLRAGG